MDSSDSLKLDENLARFLAAYDQEIEGGDAGPITVNIPMPVSGASGTERQVTPIHPDAPNEGSLGEVLPDPEQSGRIRQPFLVSSTALPPGGPHRIGRFELRRQLGKGGCGIVFLAYDPKLQREVALKIPRPEMLLNEDAKRRLIREALAAAEFDHPNLVPVYETGEIGPICYIATAFCPGQTLAEWLDRQAFPVPVRQAARLVAIVAEAVQHAHDRGVLHRDLKPNNVILQELKLEENDEPPPGSVHLRGEHLVPRLVDFGLAKLVERGGPSETGTRQILGTPKYMAPEQAQARREDIGPPADVYALGVMLYEMVAGRAPYDGASDVEVLRQSVEGKPVQPRTLRPVVPRDLEAICLKAMARDTSDRYRTAIDFADDLRRFLDGRPTVARPLAWSGRAVRWLRRNDQIVAIVVLAIIVLFVTTMATWNSYMSRQLRKDHDTVLSQQASRNRTEQEREYSRHMRDAFLAWRGGNTQAATDSLVGARNASAMLMEAPGFTHDYLARVVKTERLQIVCPAGPVTALASSPDGTRLASGHADGTLAIWDRATGNQLGTVKAHESDVSHVAFALGGRLLVTAGKGATAVAEASGWSVAKDGTITRAPEPHRVIGKDVSCLVVSSDGKIVYAGNYEGMLFKVHLTDAKQNLARRISVGHTAVVAVATSHDGKTLLTVSADGVTRHRPSSLEPLDPPGIPQRWDVSALAVTEYGLPAMGLANGDVWIVEPIRHPTIFNTGGRVRWIATTREGNSAMNSVPGRVRIGIGNDLATGDTGDILAGVFSPDGRTLYTGSQDGVIRSWDVARDCRERAATAADRITTISVSRDGASFVTVNARGATISDKGREIRLFERQPRPVAAVRFLEDGTPRGVALDGRGALVCDSGVREPRLSLAIPDHQVATTAAINADGTSVAIGDDAGRVSVWSVTDRKLLGTVDTGLRPVRRVVLSSDGRHIAAPTLTGVGVWQVGQPEIVATLATDDQAVFCFLPVGERIATAGRDGVVRVWGFAGKEEISFFGHVGRVTGLGISPDGRTLVSGGMTGEVKFWDVRTGQELLNLRRHSVPVTVIEFAASGKVLLTGGDGQVAVWDARE